MSEASDKDSHVLDTERDASVDESFSSSSLDGVYVHHRLKVG